MSSRNDHPEHAAARHHPSAGLIRRLRSRIAAGLVLVVPIWFTYVVVTFVFRLMRDASLWLFEAVLPGLLGETLLTRWGVRPEEVAAQGLHALPQSAQWTIGVFSVLLTAVLLYLLGAITTNVVGRRIVALVERLVERVPLVTVIYQATKKVMETLAGSEARPFQRVVLVPFPNQETHSVGFVTSEVQSQSTGETLYSVFVATTPNPTTGFLFMIRASEIVELDWTVEDAVKVIMSGGVLTPRVIPLKSPARPPIDRTD